MTGFPASFPLVGVVLSEAISVDGALAGRHRLLVICTAFLLPEAVIISVDGALAAEAVVLKAVGSDETALQLLLCSDSLQLPLESGDLIPFVASSFAFERPLYCK